MDSSEGKNKENGVQDDEAPSPGRKELDLLAGIAQDQKDVPDTTDPDKLKKATAVANAATRAEIRANLYMVWRVIWSVTLYVVFIGLIFYEKRFIDLALNNKLGLDPKDSVILYTTTWIGFVAQVVSVVIIAIKHFFPGDRE